MTAIELGIIDPQLEGLYRLAHELASRVAMPGGSYALAVATRELTVGVLQALAGPQSVELRVEEAPENESNRETMARAFELSIHDPLVTAWFELHGRANKDSHYRQDGASTNTAASDFRTLSALLAGRLTPYFVAQRDADELLRIVAPDESHRAALQRVLVRPAVRRRFFELLTPPEWLPLLLEMNVFARAPWRRVFPNGSWSVVRWAEGGYLGRVASDKPAEVRAILSRVSMSNDNPAVWATIAEAACAMPAPDAAALVPRLCGGLKAIPFVPAADSYADLITHLAATEKGAALTLLKTLFWLGDRPLQPMVVAENDEGPEQREFVIDEDVFATPHWLLAFVQRWEANEILTRALDAMVPVAGRETLRLMLQKARKAVTTVRGADSEAEPDSSRLWCDDLDPSSEREDPRALFAHAAWRVAKDLAARSEEDARWALTEFSRWSLDIDRRLRIGLLAVSSPRLSSEVNAFLESEDLFADDAPAPEVGDLLRNRLMSASPTAQAAVLARIIRGPGEDRLRRLVDWANEWGHETTRDTELQKWQRKQLMRLGYSLPESFWRLATQLGHTPAAPDPEELGLAEHGYWYGGGAGALNDDAESPISEDSLAVDSPESVATAVLAWASTADPGRDASYRLNDALQTAARNAPARGAAIVTALTVRTEAIPRLAPLLKGIREGFTIVPERFDEALLAVLVDICVGTIAVISDAEQSSAELTRATCSVIEDVLLHRVAAQDVERLWTTAGERLQADAIWIERDMPATPGAGVALGLQLPSGLLTLTWIRAGLRLLHLRLPIAPRPPEVEDAGKATLRTALRNVLESITGRTVSSTLGACSSLGTFLPHLIWLDEEWWLAHTVLLEADLRRPYQRPIWLANLTRGTFYEDTFQLLRPFYALSAATLPTPAPEDDSRGNPGRALVTNILRSILRGRVVLGDPDRIVEEVFAHTAAKDRTHAYWAVWANARDHFNADGPLSEQAQARLREFWKWRCSELEDAECSESRNTEASGLLWLTDLLSNDPRSTLELVLRTLHMTEETSQLYRLWETLPSMVEHDVATSCLVLERATAIELGTAYPNPTFDELAPTIRAVYLHGDDAYRARVIRLLDRLGEAGFSSFSILRPV